MPITPTSADDARLNRLLQERIAAAPDAIAFIDGDRHITFAQFGAMCAQAAAWLREEGIRPQDRVAVWLVNRVEWLALYFGLARIGAVLVSVNTRYRSEEVTHILRQSGARMLVLQPGFRKIDFGAILDGMDAAQLPDLEKCALLDAGAQSTLLGRPAVALTLDKMIGNQVAMHAMPDAMDDLSDADAPSILFTTSGTTKGPKLVVHTQRSISGHARRCAHALGFDAPGAAMLAMLPLCGVFGLCGVMAAFAAGAPVVMLDAFDDALAAALLVRHRITHTFGSDDMFRRIIAHAPGERPFPDARLFGFGAFSSAFNEEAIDAWQRGIPLTGPYGSSEVLALWSMQPHHLPVTQRIEGGGVPVAGKDAVLRIRDVESGMLLPPGQSGEIEIRSPSNFIGYFNNPEASAQAVTEDGFFRTGDLGYLRQDGSLAYQTRMGDAIRLSGFLVDPVEIEEVLRQMPGVAEAQVVGVPIDGQLRPVAFVIARAGMAIQEKALQAEAARRIAAFKVPARIWQVEAYPMTQSANGLKVQRVKLRDWAAERLSAA